jgi:hypothetical protein
LDEIEANYQTTGVLISPSVVMHTTGDPIIPVRHALQYRLKIHESNSGDLYRNLIIPRYGHCQFTTVEALVGFALLVFKTTGLELAGVHDVLASRAEIVEYDRLYDEYR